MKKKYVIHNTKYLILRAQSRAGQSLIEVLIGLTIGAILIGSAAMGIAFMLRSTSSNDNLQMASGMVQSSLDKARAFAGADWQNIYGLTKGTSTTYFLNSSSTQFFVIEGKEGVFGTDVATDLVGRWGFDEATGTIAYDMSGNNNNGTLINSPIHATSTCKLGYCLTFDGVSNYIDVSGFSGVPAFSEGTLSFWVYPTRWSNYDNVLGLQSSATNVNVIRIERSNDLVRAIFGNSSGSYNDVYSTSTLTANSWHFIVLTWNSPSSTASVYLDNLPNSNTITTWPSLYNAFRIGTGYTGRYFQGIIDDVRIYNRALSADEIKRMYESAVFSRYFVVENVCRTNDASSTISGASPCESGSLEDPSTQRITSIVEWIASSGLTDLTLVDYITRWKNAIFQQTDWSGGSGDDGVYTEPGSSYSSSTNIDTGSESFQLHGI